MKQTRNRSLIIALAAAALLALTGQPAGAANPNLTSWDLYLNGSYYGTQDLSREMAKSWCGKVILDESQTTVLGKITGVYREGRTHGNLCR